jgi:hypothetical protein
VGFCEFFFAFASLFCFGVLFVYPPVCLGRLMLFYDIPLITYQKEKLKPGKKHCYALLKKLQK